MHGVRSGSYHGTEMDGRWWRRYRGTGFFARGSGEFWTDEAGLHFRRALTQAPLSIAWDEIAALRLSRWHAGRWGCGRPILQVDFSRDGRALTAGFSLSGDWKQMEDFVADLGEKMRRR